ncbi:MAG: type II toxin-antitoxin system VapC family toxin [Burkholderiales bacterium]
MAFVADNSVVLAWFVRSQSTAYSERMLGRVAREPVHVPIVWPLEFSNALRQLERRRKIKPAATEAILGGVDALALHIDSSPPSQRRLLDLARQYDLSVYDASYLELAIRHSFKLAAQDGPLAAAAVKAGLKAG